jgi:hypothetical protein
MRVGPDDRRGPAFARPEFDRADNWTFRATRHENAPLLSEGGFVFRDMESTPS